MLEPVENVAPADVVSTLPSADAIAVLAKAPPVIVRAHSKLWRAAWNKPSVLPKIVTRFYRFGPPRSVASAATAPPYWWLYVADQPMTCIYEAGFCGHDARQPGHFYLEDDAVKTGLVVTFDFPARLRLLDLPSHAFTMGIYDALSSPDYLWCQWFAYQLQAAGLFEGIFSLAAVTIRGECPLRLVHAGQNFRNGRGRNFWNPHSQMLTMVKVW